MTSAQSPPLPLAPSGVQLAELAVLIMGPTGAGKTTLIGTMHGRGAVLNTWPLERGAPVILASKRDRIDVFNVAEWADADRLYQHLKRGPRATGYEWIALDSFTGLGGLARRRVLRERAGRGINVDPAKMTLPDWGDVGNFLNEFLWQFLGLPYPKVITAQERRYEADGLDSLVGPDTRPPVYGFLMQAMNGVGRIYSAPIGGGRFERRLRTAQHPNYATKWQLDEDRRAAFPAVIRNPDLHHILGYAYGALGAFPPPEGVDESTDVDNTGFTPI